MSYDYDFFRVTSSVQSPDDLVESNMQPIGTVSEICAALKSAFPSASLSDSGGWLDDGQSIGDVSFYDPTFMSFSVSRIDLDDVKRICRALGVVAFDGQEMEIIRG